MRSTVVLPLCLAVLLLSGCAPEPQRVDPLSSQNESSTTSQQPSEPQGGLPIRTATGTLVSIDGTTTGTVKVTVNDATKLATVDFIDLQTTYDELGVGTSLQPRGDDLCYDWSVSGSASLHPNEQNRVENLVAEALGYSVYEVVLYRKSTQAEYEQYDCLQWVVSFAPLEWAG